MYLYFLLDFLSSFTLSPSHNLWLLCSQCHCWWFVMLVAKEGKCLLLFSLRPCLVKARGSVALFSEWSFMYILLNSPKSFRHQGLENEKWLLFLPYFAQDPEPPHVSDFLGRCHTPSPLAVSWWPSSLFRPLQPSWRHASSGKKWNIKITLIHTWAFLFLQD